MHHPLINEATITTRLPAPPPPSPDSQHVVVPITVMLTIDRRLHNLEHRVEMLKGLVTFALVVVAGMTFIVIGLLAQLGGWL